MNKIFFILSVFIILSCTEKYTKPPENLLSKNVMRDILIDIHLSESYLEKKYPGMLDSAKIQYKLVEPQIFARHNITKGVFDTSYKYYTDNMGLFDEVYTEVLDSLSKKEALIKVEKANK